MENKVPPEDPSCGSAGRLTCAINARQCRLRRVQLRHQPRPQSARDATGPEFALLRFNSAVEVAAPELTARGRGVPLKVFDAERPTAANFYSGSVLSPPDQHGGWRGDKPPVDQLALIDQIRGASN